MTAAASTAPLKPIAKPKPGLHSWMLRVLEECDRAAVDFSSDPVHDLRVAIRRCRSLADGLIHIDPDPKWKEMKRAPKKLFASLGGLRDMQVLIEWIEKLFRPDDPVAVTLTDYARSREAELKDDARAELDRFDRKAWRDWSRTLPRRLSVVHPGNIIFKHLALERWTAAYDLHRLAMRSRSAVSLHQTRIGIKRFRYIVENFLPRQHSLWGADLKDVQDMLGEIHDLDVLWHTALQLHAFPNTDARSRWHEKIVDERNRRLDRYRQRMTGRQSLWQQWRLELPQQNQIQFAALSRVRVWAGFLDPHPKHSHHVSALALEIFQGLRNHGLVPAQHERSLELILQIAALAHDIGSSRNKHSRPKASAKLLRRMESPLGWDPHEIQLAAAVVRYHAKELPSGRQKVMRSLSLSDRRVVALLAGILRVANTFDTDRSGRVTRAVVEERKNQLYIFAQGFSSASHAAEEMAAARYLLESSLRRSILVRPLRPPRTGTTKGRQRLIHQSKPRLKLIA